MEHKIQRLDKEILEKARKLHGDLMIYINGHNPRPKYTGEEAALILFEEAVVFIKSLKDKLNDEKYLNGEYQIFPMKFLAKEDLNRRMIKQEVSWAVMNEIRSVIHCFIDPERYGYRGIISALWKDEVKQKKMHDKKHYKTRSVQIPNPDYKPDPDCYICKYYKKKFGDRFS